MKTIEKPKMTCLQLTMAVMLNMLGSSIILMPTKLAEVGTMSILAWLVTISGATLDTVLRQGGYTLGADTRIYLDAVQAATPPMPSASPEASLRTSATASRSSLRTSQSPFRSSAI